MGKVIFDVSMSLDGFISGANPRLEAGLGDDGKHIPLETVEVIQTADVTHLRFRVMK